MACAIRFVATKGSKVPRASIQLLCHVKPGVRAKRVGIGAVTEEYIEVCVAAQAREGEANKAVKEVIAEVLGVPKSDVAIAKGLKSREKTVVISDLMSNTTPEEQLQKIKIKLLESVAR